MAQGLRGFLILATAALAVGCAEGEGARIEFTADDAITKIINGRFTFERPEVGLLNWNGGACTATLIRDNVAITAAHCVGFSTNDAQGRPLGSFIVHRDGQQVFQYAFDAHIAYGRDFDQGGDTDTDIALLRLIQRVPADVATPVRIAARGPRAGEAVTLFGYGCGNRNNTGDSHQGRKQKLPFASGRTTNLCPGDSGGPTFLDADGTLFQINSAYNTLDGTDLFGDAVAMSARLNQQADAWSGGQQQAPPGGGEAPAPDLDCAGLFECLRGCGQDPDCAQGCARRTGAEPRRRYDAMVACSQASRCPDMSCVRDQCPAQVEACFGAGGEPAPDPDPGPQAGDGACGDMLQCMSDCRANDDQCRGGCYDRGGAAAQGAYDALAACGQANGCQDDACWRQRCGAELSACHGGGGGAQPQDPGPAPGGGLSCLDLLQCGQQCAGDQQCFSGCWGQAGAGAQQAYQAYSGCYFENGCRDGACAEQFCSAEYGACTGGGGGGGFDNGGGGGGFDDGGQGGQLACADVVGCMQGCRFGDQACAQNCYFQGSAEAQVAYAGLATCGLSNLCADEGCLQAFCPAEFGQCFQGGFAGGGGGCPNGGCPNGGCPNGGCPNGGCPNGGCPNGGPNGVANGGLRCMDIIDCFGGCADDACVNACYGRGSAQGRAGVDAIYDCAGRAGCQDYDCVERQCGAQLQACF